MRFKFYQKNLVIGLLLLLSPLTFGEIWPAQDNPKTLDYRPVNMAQFSELEVGFGEVFATADFSKLKAYYDVDPQLWAPGPAERKGYLTLLKSREDYGWGVMAYLPQGAKNWFLQVPHRYHDQWTEDIASHWWRSGQFKAVMLNTVHRHAGREKKQGINSDFSTAANNPMLAASRAFAGHFERPVVVQLHGFSKNKRKNTAAQQADVILSYGANLPNAYLSGLLLVNACISQLAKVNTLVFPAEINELGGRKNIIGQGLRQMGLIDQFVHIELSRDIRREMRKDPVLSTQILNCMVDRVK